MRLGPIMAVLASIFLSTGSASADVAAGAAPAPPPTAIHFDLGAGTYFPLAITAEGTLELPYRILVQGDLGWMPSPYSDAIIGVMGDFGVLSTTEQDLLKLAIQNSLVARISAGWRPFPTLGLEVLVGYTAVTVGGGVSGSDVVAAYLQAKGSTDVVPNDAARQVPLKATLNNFQATIAWRFLLASDKLVLRPSLSYLQCFASSTGIGLSSSRPAEEAVISKINSEIEGYLNPYFTQYVKVPVLGVTAAYRF